MQTHLAYILYNYKRLIQVRSFNAVLKEENKMTFIGTAFASVWGPGKFYKNMISLEFKIKSTS